MVMEAMVGLFLDMQFACEKERALGRCTEDHSMDFLAAHRLKVYKSYRGTVLGRSFLGGGFFLNFRKGQLLLKM